jgi:hypothetical protein
MSILSQLLEGKITLAAAASQALAWFEKIPGGPATATAVGQVLSTAAGLAGTALGDVAATATATIEDAINTGITAALGAGAVTLTPAVDAALTNLETMGVQAVQNEIAAIRAKLGGTVTETVSQQPPSD